MWLRGLVLSLSIVLVLLLFYHIQSGDKGVLVNLSLESDVQSGDIGTYMVTLANLNKRAKHHQARSIGLLRCLILC